MKYAPSVLCFDLLLVHCVANDFLTLIATFFFILTTAFNGFLQCGWCNIAQPVWMILLYAVYNDRQYKNIHQSLHNS